MRHGQSTIGAIGVERGDPLMLGMQEVRYGFNFAVFSRHARGITLLLFDQASDEPVATVPLDPERHRSGDVWHARVTGDLRGKSYALRAEGPWEPEQGHRFDASRFLLDPYALLVSDRSVSEGHAQTVISDNRFDWQGTPRPRHAWRDTVIYETHVRGLTVHPSSGAVHPGQYLGVIDKIPYLLDLGVTAVELMPVQEFMDVEPGRGPRAGQSVRNYWGYNPVALFAPKAGYASSPQRALMDFKTMVRELHQAGIEVILDVVFNHTAEGDETGPTFSFRGLDNAIYYLLTPDKGRYIDFTGCGNTLNCNHPVVRAMIVDCLRHWAVHMHVDGFRFDLASILGRDPEGNLLRDPPLLARIAEDPVLRDVKLIAEAWDLGGAFQVGSFPGQRWAEWNCHYRDDVRRFWRGDPGITGAFATRLAGSADLYQAGGETPLNSVNFITSHDGFTINDLVSYARKHNEANGEDNRDGMAESFNENNGVEGPSEDATVEAMRLRQIKNMLVTLFVSRGVPMLLGGDEFRRTQRGNNNAYCQDNEISWYDWRLVQTHAGLVRFVARLIALRKAHPVLSAERFYTDAEIRWIGAEGGQPEWHRRDNRLGCVIEEGGAGVTGGLCLLFNATLQPCRFVLPDPLRGPWEAIVDTAADSPNDISDAGAEPLFSPPPVVELGARSAMVLLSR